ncbi:hypothetical protein V497_00671 [Pseudogymnoascus sp. VKM F-4516 (FW-969)]|nr:hypothetical protein V497_00671 [Pseudogymnoascus sp. VKM F-4516 (FW-969)]
MNQYTDAQRLHIREWQASGMSWEKIQRRYNTLYNDNRSLGALRKVGKRGRITSYCLDCPPLKRQKPDPIATRAPERKAIILGLDIEKEWETTLSLQIEVVAKLAETASSSFGDLISQYGDGST